MKDYRYANGAAPVWMNQREASSLTKPSGHTESRKDVERGLEVTAGSGGFDRVQVNTIGNLLSVK